MSENNMSLAGRYICFTLGKEKFAIPLLQVKEVIANIETTPIPKTPDYFKGIMNLRGQVISVIDLTLKLNIGKDEIRKEKTIVILDTPISLGVIVDSVDCVVTYEENEISESGDFDKTLSANILGVAKKEKTMTLLLDLNAVLNPAQYKELKVPQLKAA